VGICSWSREEDQSVYSETASTCRLIIMRFVYCGRYPDRIFGSLRPLFPPAVFPALVNEGNAQGSNEFWLGWSGLMVHCPKLFGAFSRFWIPTLSIEEVKSWKMTSVPDSLYAIWAPNMVRIPTLEK
jgi:hypothetical protein